MLTYRSSGPRLTIRYRFGPLRTIGALLLLGGSVLLVIAALRFHTVDLTCTPARVCTLERRGVISSERVAVTNLRGAEAGFELVLRADPDVVMGPRIERDYTPNYLNAAAAVEAWVREPSRPLAVSVVLRSAIRLWGTGGLLVVLGLCLLSVFALGSHVRIDRDGTFERLRSIARGNTADIKAVEVRGNSVIVTMRDGREHALLATLAGRKTTPPRPRPDLDEAVRRIREHLQI